MRSDALAVLISVSLDNLVLAGYAIIAPSPKEALGIGSSVVETALASYILPTGAGNRPIAEASRRRYTELQLIIQVCHPSSPAKRFSFRSVTISRRTSLSKKG